jgi:hypothetical protein
VQPVSWRGGLPDPATLTPPRGHSEAFGAPQPLHLLAIAGMAVAVQDRVGAPVAQRGWALAKATSHRRRSRSGSGSVG